MIQWGEEGSGEGSGTGGRKREGEGSGTGPLLLSQAAFPLAHISNSGLVPLSSSDLSRFPLWPAGMAEGNRETFGPRVGLSSHGSPAKGGPKSKCLARVKIARTSAGPLSSISDPSRFPNPAFPTVQYRTRPAFPRLRPAFPRLDKGPNKRTS